MVHGIMDLQNHGSTEVASFGVNVDCDSAMLKRAQHCSHYCTTIHRSELVDKGEKLSIFHGGATVLGRGLLWSQCDLFSLSALSLSGLLVCG